MHSPKTKKALSSNTHQTEQMQSVSTRYVLSGDKRGTLEEGKAKRSQHQTAFFHNAND
ncbi:unnamed protein product [Staurois parvus]|uniref:Uncharacterized protein n=1 Tax=Staurois parvus TaxID=386267 RepID=A0ABN9CLI7_9NEOB|nr:unnamed protein product [Staurois parvus]